MKIFYHKETTADSQSIVLSEEESFHAAKVLRVTNGDKVVVLNGEGLEAEAVVEKADAKKCRLEIQSVTFKEKPQPEISIALAMIKKRERMEWFAEKAVELGAAEIIFFQSAHTEKAHADLKRIERIAISALKQSGNAWLPEIRAGISLNQLVEQEFADEKFIGYCPTGKEELLSRQYAKGKNARVLIGPEGDFSPAEVEQALRHDFRMVNLGPLRLRAETAALTALLTLQILNQC